MNPANKTALDHTPDNTGRLVVTGHVVIDEIIDIPNQTVPRLSLGGPVSYSSIALKSLGYKCEAVTKLGIDFPLEYERLLEKEGGLELSRWKVSSSKTTSYRIDRSGSSRKLWLVSRCSPISIDDFSDYLGNSRSGTLIVNPVAGEISSGLLERLSVEFGTLLVDSQGFVRQIPAEGGEVSMKSGLDLSSLSKVKILKTDRAELAAWTGFQEFDTSIKKISEFVEVLLVTSGPGVVDLYKNGNLEIRARPFDVFVADSTGAGDIMLATFAARYTETQDLKESLVFSVSSATLSVRSYGVQKGTLDKTEVIRMMQKVKLL